MTAEIAMIAAAIAVSLQRRSEDDAYPPSCLRAMLIDINLKGLRWGDHGS